MKVFLLIILGLMDAACGQTVECPGPYHAIGNGCYTFPNTLVTWFDANQVCQFSGGYVANIQSAEEQSALKAYHDTYFNDTVYHRWIGVTDSLSDRIWRWVPSGATVDYSTWGTEEPWTGDHYNCAAWLPITDIWLTYGCCDLAFLPLCEARPLSL